MYSLMEKNILENIGLLSLSDLVKISHNTLTHNIGSNHFQEKLELSLLNKGNL